MLEIQRTPRKATRRVHLVLAGLLVSLLVATSAQAIPYFNADFGFDNSILQLDVDYVIPLEADFPFVASGVTDPAVTDVGLLSIDVVNDTSTSIDRTITWTIVNNAPEELTEFILFLTALSPTDFDYSAAVIDVEIGPQAELGQFSTQGVSDPFDPMVIASYGPYFFAGYHFTLDDFGEDLTTTRTFRYTVDVPEAASGPPELGIAYTSMVNVPEPATGLLFASALLLAAGAGRRQQS